MVEKRHKKLTELRALLGKTNYQSTWSYVGRSTEKPWQWLQRGLKD